MIETAREAEKRLGSMLCVGSSSGPQKLVSVVKSDVYNLLSNYFVLEEEDLLIKLDNEENGDIVIKMLAKSSSIKPLNYIQ